MPRRPNKELAAFRHWRDATHATPRYECTYCGQTGAKSTSRQLEHLKECTPYLRHPRDIERGVERVGRVGGTSTDPRQLPGVPSPMLLPVEAISIKQHADAMTVYMNARPFGSFEDEYSRTAALYGFQNYEPPRRKDLAGEWSDICYEEVYREAQHSLKMAEYINTVMDESTDIAGNRIINLSFVTPHGVFYYARPLPLSRREVCPSIM